MAKFELEEEWREEVRRLGEAQSRDPSNRGLFDEAESRIRSPGDQAEARRLLDQQTHHYFQWGFVAVLAAIIVGLIVFGLTFVH
jgi:hypothetical protein